MAIMNLYIYICLVYSVPNWAVIIEMVVINEGGNERPHFCAAVHKPTVEAKTSLY